MKAPSAEGLPWRICSALLRVVGSDDRRQAEVGVECLLSGPVSSLDLPDGDGCLRGREQHGPQSHDCVHPRDDVGLELEDPGETLEQGDRAEAREDPRGDDWSPGHQDADSQGKNALADLDLVPVRRVKTQSTVNLEPDEHERDVRGVGVVDVHLNCPNVGPMCVQAGWRNTLLRCTIAQILIIVNTTTRLDAEVFRLLQCLFPGCHPGVNWLDVQIGQKVTIAGAALQQAVKTAESLNTEQQAVWTQYAADVIFE